MNKVSIMAGVLLAQKLFMGLADAPVVAVPEAVVWVAEGFAWDDMVSRF